MDFAYKIEIEPFELVYQIGNKEAMRLVLEIEDCVNDLKWTKSLILKMISHMEENCEKDEMTDFIKKIKRKARVK
jgi:hypothetical protein